MRSPKKLSNRSGMMEAMISVDAYKNSSESWRGTWTGRKGDILSASHVSPVLAHSFSQVSNERIAFLAKIVARVVYEEQWLHYCSMSNCLVGLIRLYCLQNKHLQELLLIARGRKRQLCLNKFLYLYNSAMAMKNGRPALPITFGMSTV